MSIAIWCRLQLDVVCKVMLLVGIPSGDMTWALVNGRPCATLHEGVSCAIFECKVICVSMETRSYAISRSKVVYDLGIQVAHEGSSYVECMQSRNGVDRTRHGVECGAEHLVNS